VLLDAGAEARTLLTTDVVRHRPPKQLIRELAGRMLVVRDRWAGLAESGLLDSKCDEPPRVLDTDTPGDPWLEGDVVPFRVRIQTTPDVSEADDDWFEVRRIPLDRPPDVTDEDTPVPHLVVETWGSTSTDEDSRSSGNPQRLDAHHAETADHAERLARRLGLDEQSRLLLAVAARLHDEGKRASRWQRAFHAPPGGDWAKTRGPVDVRALDGYRHELGSYLRVLDHPDVNALDDAGRDLVLHLIASHHGHARPVIPARGYDDLPPTALRAHAAGIVERFVRLQRRLGPWQLAWWEAVLRSADQQASRANDARRTSRRSREEVPA